MTNWAKLLILMAFSLFTKFYLFRFMLFGDKSVWNFLSSESSSIVLFLLLLAIISKNKIKAVFTIGNTFVSLVLFAILVYFSYYGKIPTYQALSQLGQVGEVHDSVKSLLTPSYFLLFADLVFFLLLQGRFKYVDKSVGVSSSMPRKYLLLAFSIVLLFSIGKVKAEKAEQILNENKRAEKMGMLPYQIDSMFLTNDEKFAAISVSREEVQRLKGEELLNQTPKHFGIAKNKNVIVIQLEAFQNFLIDLKMDGKEVTPHLNQLLKESYYFPHVFQQIGIGNTSDAEFISNTSLYPVGDTPMSQKLGESYIPSLPRLLEKMKYDSMTFHVNHVQFWNRDHLYPSLGFEKYYDQDFFGQEDVIGLGPSDDVLYRKAMSVLEEKKEAKQLFFAQFVSLTGHHPFTVSDSMPKLSIPSKYQGTTVGDYIIAQHYADAALGRFLDGLKKNGLYDETVIVVYGDHYGLPKQESESQVQLLKELFGREYDWIDIFNIPLIIKVPGVDKASQIDTVGGQLDIMPTVANLLGLSLDNNIFFGKDLLNTKDNLLGMRFYLPTGSFFTNEILFIPGYGFEDGTAFTIRTHEKIKDISMYKDSYDRVIQLLRTSDAYTNQLPLRE